MNPGISSPASKRGIRHFFQGLIAGCTLLLATAAHAEPFVPVSYTHLRAHET